MWRNEQYERAHISTLLFVTHPPARVFLAWRFAKEALVRPRVAVPIHEAIACCVETHNSPTLCFCVFVRRVSLASGETTIRGGGMACCLSVVAFTFSSGEATVTVHARYVALRVLCYLVPLQVQASDSLSCCARI